MAGFSRRQLAAHAVARLSRGDAPHDVMQELAAYLIDTNRTREAELVIRDIDQALLTHGVAYARVTSARALSDEARESLKQFISSQYENIDTVTLEESIDESLLAGVKLELPDKQLDASARTKLEKLTMQGGM